MVSVLVMPAGLLGLLAMPFGFDGMFWRLMDGRASAGWSRCRNGRGASRRHRQIASFGTGPLALMSAGIIALGLLRTPLRWVGAGLIAFATIWAA